MRGAARRTGIRSAGTERRRPPIRRPSTPSSAPCTPSRAAQARSVSRTSSLSPTSSRRRSTSVRSGQLEPTRGRAQGHAAGRPTCWPIWPTSRATAAASTSQQPRPGRGARGACPWQAPIGAAPSKPASEEQRRLPSSAAACADATIAASSPSPFTFEDFDDLGRRRPTCRSTRSASSRAPSSTPRPTTRRLLLRELARLGEMSSRLRHRDAAAACQTSIPRPPISPGRSR